MQNLRFLILSVLIPFSFDLTLLSQTVVTIPVYPVDMDSCSVIFDASKGNAELKNEDPPIYAHAGVITNLSASPTDWRYVIADWTQNTAKATMTPLGNNRYKLTIKPGIRAWYGVPESETILKMAFVFRNSDGSKVGRETDGSDIYADVYPSATSVNIILPSNRSLIVSQGDPIPFKAVSPLAETMELYINNTLRKTIVGTIITDTIPADNFGSDWKRQWVKVLAMNDTASVADSFSYTVIPPPAIAPLPVGITDGINYIDSATVILSLYAPEKNTCFVIGDFNDWQEDSSFYMFVTPDKKRFWLEMKNLEPRKEYLFQYLVDGNLRIADPYSEKVCDPEDKYISVATYPGLLPYPEGKTTEIASYLQTAQSEYAWNNIPFTPPATTDLVIYEILLRDFLAKHDYPTLIDTLGYLQKLGVNAIELMPVMEFEGNISWGYNPDFMFAPDKYYGTKDGLKQFIEAAHARGMAVILDIVLNHQFGKSPLVRLYWDAANNRPAANSPWFNQIPKHPFNVGFDFNHESPSTREYCKRILSHWLTEYHIDGFRFDLSKGLTQTNSYPDNAELMAKYDASRINILRDYRDQIFAINPDAIIILEHFAENNEEKVLSSDGMLLWGNMNYNYNEATMGWHGGGKSDFSWISYKKRGWSKPNLVGYMESHDEERLAFKNITYGNSANFYHNVKDTTIELDRMQMAAAFFYTIPGPKMLWQFGELGYDYSINYPTGDESSRLAPKPVRWDYYSQWRRKYLYNVYASLIDLKKNNDAFRSDDFSMELSGAMKRININHTSMDVTIVGNFDVYPRVINPLFQQTGRWYDYFSGDSIDIANTSDPIELMPGEYHLYTSVKLEKPLFTGIDNTQKKGQSDNDILTVFPNPSSGLFNIVFELNRISDVILTIYDFTGRQVYVLLDEEMTEGSHKILWNCSNSPGEKVPPGIYLCKITIGNYTEMKKLIVE